MFFVGLIMLGFLVGNLVGLTSDSVLASLLPLLLAFSGGSAIALIKKYNEKERRLIGASISCISLACLLGTYTGILVCEHQVLTPIDHRGGVASALAESGKYLRNYRMSAVDDIDMLYRSGLIQCDQAYKALYDLVRSKEVTP